MNRKPNQRIWQMQKAACWAVVVISVVLLAGCAGSGMTRAGSHAHKPTLLGKWESTKIEGEAEGIIIKIQTIFESESDYSTTATWSDGDTGTVTGTYSIEGNKLITVVYGEKSSDEFELHGDVLIIRDPETGNSVTLKRR